MIYYRLKTGRLASEHDMEIAFEIMSSMSRNSCPDEYLAWLRFMRDSYGGAAIDGTELSIEDFLNGGQRVAAIRRYMDLNGCTLREARDAVAHMEERE